ncbi:MAG: Lrp/AsnC family transcriptional regulator [Chloroflexi bacterium]|nr:Lrp/AsnC family transcriptional regulator [Chloroflexota bacterium]MCH8201048.1 Lrp/AsnC family transcriptional regulator [Chloroflexota bacterium]MCI0783248.1 Lrp/AsnC family transcriptional regulator [Chloroflexota bacterium]MCI0814444.1 Lrp/AsnC family transcriptional regulator [Chloroflexota bacterium]MCI0817818.1 Lrp/AsnC family transcriptional regulator [Chloroflexota bacterium]
MAIKAYVLIVTDPGNTKNVLEEIQGMQGIEAVHEVMGPYDIVVEISADNLQEIPRILGDRIRPIEGVQSTTSLVTFPD